MSVVKRGLVPFGESAVACGAVSVIFIRSGGNSLFDLLGRGEDIPREETSRHHIPLH
jgi:hypothetical protein